MIQLDSKDILSGQAVLDVSPGQWGMLAVYVSGTNQSGQAVTAANLGTFTGSIIHNQFLNVEFDDLQAINAVTGGQISATSATAGAFTFVAFISASVGKDGNTFDVHGSDNMQIKLDLSGVTSTIVASGTVELYGIRKVGEQEYIPEIGASTPTVSASTRQTIPIKQQNVSFVAIANQTNLDHIQVKQDKELVADVDATPLQKISNGLAALVTIAAESDYSTLSMIPLALSGRPDEFFSNQISVQVAADSGGTCNPHLITIGRAYSTDLLSRSRSASEARRVTKLKEATATQPELIDVAAKKGDKMIRPEALVT